MLSKDRTGCYHALVVLKRCRIATRLDNYLLKEKSINKW